MDIFILTFRAASTQVLCFAWIMAVVQRVNQAVIFPATLKATELTDSHTDSCGSLTTRCHIVNCEDWRDVMAHDAKPSSHLPHFLRPEGSSGSLRPDVVHENLHLLWLWVSENVVEAPDAAKWCRRWSFAKICQHVYTLSAEDQEQNWYSAVCRFVTVTELIWGMGRRFWKVHLFMNTNYAELFFSLTERDGKHKRVLMTWERIRTMWVDKRISEKQSHWVIEDTVWMSMNWWTRKRREIKVTDWMQALSGESEESELKWNGERREKQERDR